MIYQFTTVDLNVRAEKKSPGSDWLERMIHHIQDRYDLKVIPMRNIGATNYQVHFLTEHESLASYESYIKELEGDTEFRALINEAVERGSLRDSREQLFRTLR